MATTIPTVYLLHFSAPVGNLANPRAQASHYLGWAMNLERRIRQHRAGQGSYLTQAAVRAGITFEVVATWPGDYILEKRLKALKATPRLCPICGCRHPGGRLHVTASWHQLSLFDDPFALVPPPPTTRVDWYEVRSRRRAHTFTGDRALGEALAADLGIPW